MAFSRRNVWLWKIGGGLALVLLIGGAYVGWNWPSMANSRLAHRVRNSGTTEERLAAAHGLLEKGEPARGEIKQLLLAGDAETCAVLSVALHETLEDLPSGEPRSTLAVFLLDLSSRCGEPGQVAIAELMPSLLRGATPAFLASARESVKLGLQQDSPEVAQRAVRLAMRSDLNLKGEIVPALHHADARVRKEAMLAVGPASLGDTVIGTEDLFQWLHDPDGEVRIVCEAALATRGLEPEQIEAARMLTNSAVAERLSLLVQLRNGGKALGEPGPWLERLSRDAEPAVRAGAARVACEKNIPFAGWVKKLAREDPDASVRQIAAYHRGRTDVQQAGYQGD